MWSMLAFIISTWQWIIVLAIILLLFGNRIPGLARSLGSGITEFKKGLKDGDGDKGKELPPSQSGAAAAPQQPQESKVS